MAGRTGAPLARRAPEKLTAGSKAPSSGGKILNGSGSARKTPNRSGPARKIFNGLVPDVDGLGREQLAGIQRVRVLSAATEVVAEYGVANVTVAHLVARSGVSRRTFYELFSNCEDCFIAAFQEALEHVGRQVVQAYGAGGRWRERIRAGLTVLLELLDAEPDIARLLVVESLAGGPRALEHRQRVSEALRDAIDQGRDEAKPGQGPSSLTAESVVGAVLSVIHARVSQHDQRSLLELVNPLMGVIVLPYLGPAAARKEIEHSIPAGRPHTTQTAIHPLRDLGMRLTYRTIRALMAIGAQPGSSNRTIGEHAGITDQGQISKLLARLQNLGLITNTGAGHTQGEPNAWQLTPKGTSVHDAIAIQPDH